MQNGNVTVRKVQTKMWIEELWRTFQACNSLEREHWTTSCGAILYGRHVLGVKEGAHSLAGVIIHIWWKVLDLKKGWHHDNIRKGQY